MLLLWCAYFRATLLILFLSFLPSTNAFNATKVGGSAFVPDEVLKVRMGSSSNIYACGYFSGTGTVGNSAWSGNFAETGYVVRYDSSLSTSSWTCFVNGSASSNERVTGISPYGGYVFITGFTDAPTYTIGAISLPSLNSPSYGMFLAALYVPDGSVYWAKHKSSYNSVVKSYDIISDGTKVCVTGMYSGLSAAVGGSTFPVSTTDDWMIACYAANNASHLWSWGFAGPGIDYGRSIAILPTENVVVVVGKVDSYLGLSPTFSQNVNCTVTCTVLMMFNGSTGQGIWFQQLHSVSNSVTPWDLAVNGYNIYLVGTCNGNFYVNGSTLVQCAGGSSDPFLLKFDLSGNLAWQVPLPAAGQQDGYAISASATEVLVSGTYISSTPNYGGGPMPNSANIGTWIASFDSNSAFRWSVGYPANSSATLRPISAAIGSTSYAIGGVFTNNVTVESVTLSSTTSGDGFLLSNTLPSQSPSPSMSSSPSSAPPASPTPTRSPSRTPSQTRSPTPSEAPFISPTPSATPTQSAVPSVTPSESLVASASPELSPSPSTSVSPSHSVTPTSSARPSASPQASLSSSPSTSATASFSASPSTSFIPAQDEASFPTEAVAAGSGAGGGVCIFGIVVAAVLWMRRRRRPDSDTTSSELDEISISEIGVEPETSNT